MAAADNPADPFKKALAEASRTLAGDFELGVTYSADAPGLAEGQMRLPQISRRMRRDEVLRARGTADALALRLRYHDDATHARFAPQGDGARRCTRRWKPPAARRGRPAHARHGRQHRRQDRRGCGAQGLWRYPRGVGRAAATAAGYLIRHLATGPRPAGRGRQCHGAVARLHRGRCEAGATSTTSCDVLKPTRSAFARFARG
jgi:cobaltochelatase CobT